ncbi:MAG: dockerin type I domain-containing protein [bacterium]
MKFASLVSIVAAATTVSVALAQSDDCSSPMPIAGGGVYQFNLTGFGASQGVASACIQGGAVVRDGWYCWTADCDGMVTIETCSNLQIDTTLAIYPFEIGCACPGDVAPLCCSDDSCGKQARITCEVRCGQRYLIRLGAKNSPTYVGQMTIQCNGAPCESHNEPIVCAPCCGGRPEIVDSAAVNFNQGAVAAGTNFRMSNSDPAVVLFDLGNQGSAPIGTVTSWNTGRYSHASWSQGNLGTLFGVVIDDEGDTVVTHTVVYWQNYLGTLGGAGSVYRLDGATGAASELIRLPNAITSAHPQGSGLGQVDFSCEYNLYYVSNFEDGRVYAINKAGAVKGTFDHATGAITGALPTGGLQEPNDVAGPVPLGQRVWAVKAVDGRLVYSLWVEDSGNFNATRNNEIWSVALDANGLFVAGTAQLELSMPEDDVDVTNPVADIAFNGDCCMFAAERGMSSLEETSAHVGRLIKFCVGKTGWERAPEDFLLGTPSFGRNSVGGVDIEGGVNDRVWSIGDALELGGSNNIYGLIGFPSTGGDRDNSILIDFDNILTSQQKTQLGSIDLSCVDATTTNCEFATKALDCVPTTLGVFNFNWEVEITNGSSQPANLLILSDPAFAPNNVIVLNPPLQPGNSIVLNIPIVGLAQGQNICFNATLASSSAQECCSEEICLEMPECDCFLFDAIVKDNPGVGTFDVSLSVFNVETFVGEWFTFAVAPGYAATVSPTLVNIPSLNPWTGMAIAPVTITTALPPGSPIILIVGMHSATFHPCCFHEIQVTVPAQAGSSTPGDVNADGRVDAADLSMILSNWGQSGQSDLNGDGTTDAQDLSMVLANWG